MGINLEDLLAKRPVQRNSVEARKARMLDQVRAYRLKELRKAQHLTQKQVAERLEVGQNRVSTIERGELDRIQLDTLRRYVESVGGTLRIEVELGDDRFQIA
ncbi:MULTISPECIES: XRE family transcriptional regulator [Rhodococcus]|uniref:XRE family transcriptional regulator n=1 Tax=Rhodococcus TaxID=1827 RepID=UPI001C560141|nr:XRE family transcriptional regulator [Rhodococcus sp. LW-XY12]QXU56625.1 helix-turn-helix domain-containing protein [Rhodococcus sp. LW-XY12]